MPRRFDAIIIGAGPAGSTAAIRLSQAGWRVALIEKQPFPRQKVCGECIAASNLPLLSRLGVGAAFAAAAGPELRQVALLRGTHSVVADLPPAGDGSQRWGRALGRDRLDSLLLQQASRCGAQLLQPWTVQHIAGGPGHWQCRLHAGKQAAMTVTAALLIDAHGSWEAIPGQQTTRPARPSDLLAFKAHFHDAALPDGLLPILSFAGGYGGMVMADQGRLTVACCIRRRHWQALRHTSPGLSAGDVVETMLRRQCQGVDVALQPAHRSGPWLAAGPLAPGIRLGVDDRWFRIGNAAAEAHPIIGEGISMALQSAWLLCSHLLDSADQRAPLADSEWQARQQQRYIADWRRLFVGRLYLAATFAQLAMRPLSAAPLMSLLHIWPGLLSRGAAWSGKTHFATRRSTP